MDIHDTFHSLASHDTPVAPRRLAVGRYRHPAHVAGDLDPGAGPLSGLPVSDAASPQPLCSHRGGPPLGPMACCAPTPWAEVLLRQWPLSTPHVYRAAVIARGSLGSADAAARALAGAHRRGAGGAGRRTPKPCPGRGRQAQAPLAPAASSAPSTWGHPSGAWRRRWGLSKRSDLWDGAARSRAASSAGPPARSCGRDRGPWVTGPSRRRRDHP